MDNLSNLIKAGFTEYEARVYQELLGEHPEILTPDNQALENQNQFKKIR